MYTRPSVPKRRPIWLCLVIALVGALAISGTWIPEQVFAGLCLVAGALLAAVIDRLYARGHPRASFRLRGELLFSVVVAGIIIASIVLLWVTRGTGPGWLPWLLSGVCFVGLFTAYRLPTEASSVHSEKN